MAFKGISELISESDNGSIVIIKHECIKPDDSQTRKNWESPETKAHIDNLAKSMLLTIPNTKKQYGIREPLSIEEIGKNEYKIVKGESRWRAAAIAGIEDIPCIIKKYDSDTHERRYDHVTENTLRKGLNLYEIAKAIDDDIKKGISRKDIVVIYGIRSESQISKYLSILKADPIIQDAAQNDVISDVNLVYDLKSLKKDELDKWNNMVYGGESARAAYTKVAPKKKKTGKKDKPLPSVVFTQPEIESLLIALGIKEKPNDVKAAKKIILEHVNNE